MALTCLLESHQMLYRLCLKHPSFLHICQECEAALCGSLIRLFTIILLLLAFANDACCTVAQPPTGWEATPQMASVIWLKGAL